MDQKSVESILSSIQNLKKVQRVIANKVIKLSDDFKDTIEQMEINNNERFEKLEKNENDKSAAVVTILESVVKM